MQRARHAWKAQRSAHARPQQKKSSRSEQAPAEPPAAAPASRLVRAGSSALSELHGQRTRGGQMPPRFAFGGGCPAHLTPLLAAHDPVAAVLEPAGETLGEGLAVAPQPPLGAGL